MSQYHGVPSNHIMWWHVVEHSLSILYAPTFCIHVNQAGTYKVVWMVEALINIWLQWFWKWENVPLVEFFRVFKSLLQLQMYLKDVNSCICPHNFYYWHRLCISTYSISCICPVIFGIPLRFQSPEDDQDYKMMYVQYWIQSRCHLAIRFFREQTNFPTLGVTSSCF